MQEDQLKNAIDRVFAATDAQVEELQTMTYEQLLAWVTSGTPVVREATDDKVMIQEKGQEGEI